MVKQIEVLRSPSAIGRAIAYIGRLDTGGVERIVDEGGRDLGPEDALAAAREWVAPAIADRNSGQVLARHFVLTLPTSSAAYGQQPAAEAAALEALEAAASATFGDWSQRYVAARHRDTAHPHLHVVVHWWRPGGRLLPLDPSGVGLDALRHAVAEAARIAGFDVDGTRTADVALPDQVRPGGRLSELNPELSARVRDEAWRRNRRALAASLRLWNDEPWVEVAARRFTEEASAGCPAPAGPVRATTAAGPASPYSERVPPYGDRASPPTAPGPTR